MSLIAFIEFLITLIFNFLSHRGDGKFFIIRSRSSGLVLEVKEGNPGPGTPLVTAYPEKGAARQLFYADDVTGHVRSQLNNFCIDGESV